MKLAVPEGPRYDEIALYDLDSTHLGRTDRPPADPTGLVQALA
jgi:hypothetical protein